MTYTEGGDQLEDGAGMRTYFINREDHAWIIAVYNEPKLRDHILALLNEFPPPNGDLNDE